MRFLIRTLDRFLRWRFGIFEFSQHPTCVYRLRLTSISKPRSWPGHSVEPGAQVLELHLWNERMPDMPLMGADITWGIKAHRRLAFSYRHIAEHLAAEPSLAKVEALTLTTILILGDGSAGTKTYFERLGFRHVPIDHPLGRFGEFWENVYSWLLMWTYNPGSTRGLRIPSLRRCEAWVSREDFLRRFGPRTRESGDS